MGSLNTHEYAQHLSDTGPASDQDFDWMLKSLRPTNHKIVDVNDIVARSPYLYFLSAGSSIAGSGSSWDMRTGTNTGAGELCLDV